MKRLTILTFLAAALFLPFSATAQELNCKVVVNADKVPGSNKSIFKSLQSAVSDFLNQTRWTDMHYDFDERIECNMLITINSQTDEKTFSASLQVQSRRPVFASSYFSSLLNWQDEFFNFQYIEMSPLEYVDGQFTDNLTQTLAYYAYLIIALDCDSYKLKSGTPYYEKAERIVNLAQSTGGDGWKAFADPHNRYAMINNLVDNNLQPFRESLYTYHRLGLDLMSQDAAKGRIAVAEALTKMQDANRARPQCVAISAYVGAKRDEIISIMHGGNTQQKKQAYDIMASLDPSQSDKYEHILK